MLSTLAKVKSYIDDKKFIIALLSLVLLIGLFFIPFSRTNTTYNEGISFYSNVRNLAAINSFMLLPPENVSTELMDTLNEAVVISSVKVALYFAFLLFTVFIVIISKKKRIIVPVAIPIAFFFIFFIVGSMGELLRPSFGFYISLMYFLGYILYCVMALVLKYAKPKPPKEPKPPKPHKPTSKERIAELERQVEELKNSSAPAHSDS